jgi:RNA polymerase sigma-70 factor, ECF subfamily
MSDAGDETARAVWRRGSERYPELSLDLATFTKYLRARLTEEVDPQRFPASDLFLSCACLTGVPGAVERFADEYRASLATFVARVTHEPHSIEELVGVLLSELLAAGDWGEPRLAGYAGRGPLRAWLRMLAVRRSINEARDGDRHARLEHRLYTEATSASVDPEVSFIKQRYGPDFQAAFRDASCALPATERALLRLHYGQALPLAELAAMHGWSKPTASRRVAAARAALLEAACKLLRERLRLDGEELESLFRVVRSQLEMSLAGIMRTEAPR